MTITLQTLTGDAMLPALSLLAELRVAVFREFPYLYEGTAAAEMRHLREFAARPDAALVVAWDGSAPVGCATCMRLADAGAGVTAPFRAAGLEVADYFYFGESVLLPAYRGQGVGVRFFAAREAHARRVSACDYTAFCAVIRPADHPMRPSGAVGLEGFWRNRGYTPCPTLVSQMRWTEIGGAVPVDHALGFWTKALR